MKKKMTAIVKAIQSGMNIDLESLKDSLIEDL